MTYYAAFTLLQEFQFFYFEPATRKFIADYTKRFSKPDDPFENQFRSNLAAIGSAEFAYLRGVLNEDLAYRAHRPVLPIDAKLATMTADTLRTRPCLTVRDILQGGNIRASDFFMFSGEARKAGHLIDEAGQKPIDLAHGSDFLNLGHRLYRGPTAQWESEELADLYSARFDTMFTVFAYLRMAAARNLDDAQVKQDLENLVGELGGAPLLAAGGAT
jgi:hypothetical protein